MGLRNHATLSVSTVTDIVMLVAPHKDSDQLDYASETGCGTTDNTLLHGTVALSLSKRRVVNEILVELIARQSVIIDGFRHSYGIREASVRVPFDARCLEPGTYHFPFELVVPSNAAPSERIPYGRTQHSIIASMKGIGQLGRTMTATRPITIVSQHSAGLPPPFNLDTVAFSGNLGPIYAEMSSPYLTVAGNLHLDLKVTDIIRPVRVDEVRVEIVQNYETRALDERWNSHTNGRDIIPIWNASEETEPTICAAGQSFSIEKHLRLPKEGVLRPTTPKACVTGVKVSHKIMVIITYTPLAEGEKKQKKEFCIGMPATISSCRSMVDGNQLPAYEKCETASKAPGYATPPCLCELSEVAREAFFNRFAEVWLGDTRSEPLDLFTARKRSNSQTTSSSSSTVDIVS